ncbi:MAG TPA: c-type cytochrome [Telluria sp.]|nr:c-type cytochrome [Telluria sp.]
MSFTAFSRILTTAALLLLAGACQAAPAVDACLACHGVAGQGSLAGAPRLAGKNPDYLAHALSMFRAGTRASPIMQGIAHGMSDSDMQAFATYFSQQHPPRPGGAPTPAPALVAAGKQLAENGAGPDLAACFSCHAAGGKGNGARFPSIAGESPAFLVERLHAFQARAKGAPPPPGSMTSVAAKMDETQIQQAAAYLSQIDP